MTHRVMTSKLDYSPGIRSKNSNRVHILGQQTKKREMPPLNHITSTFLYEHLRGTMIGNNKYILNRGTLYDIYRDSSLHYFKLYPIPNLSMWITRVDYLVIR